MTDRICIVPGCGREYSARRMCSRHYQNWRLATPPDKRPLKLRLWESLAERYREKVAVAGPNECWLWTGFCDPEGYGRIFSSQLRTKTATRIGWQLAYGEPVPDDLNVCHHCDNPPCCNPAHWYLGTDQDNADDRVRRGRASQKLTAADVSAIRAALAEGRNQYEIAAQYGVSQSLISHIKRGHRSAAA